MAVRPDDEAIAARSASAHHGSGLLRRGDVMGGLTAAVVLIAINGSYGIVAFASLGPTFAAPSFLFGVYGAVIGTVMPALFGARGPALGGPSAALALLVPTLLAPLATDPRMLLAGGRPDFVLMVAFVSLGVLIAGIGQVILGTLRLGVVVRYVPYPVHAGFMNGVAALMMLAVLPHAMGIAGNAHFSAWRQGHPLSLVVAAVTLAATLRPPTWSHRVPAYLSGLFAGTATHHILLAVFGDSALGPMFGTLEFDWPRVATFAALVSPDAMLRVHDHLGVVLQFAAALAVTSSMQTLLASSVIDGLTHERRDGEAALRAQGGSNIVAAVFGVLPGATSVSFSTINLDAGATGTSSRVFFGLFTVALLAFGTVVMRQIPMAAIAGVFMAAAWSLVDGWSRRASVMVARSIVSRRRPPHSLWLSYAVMALVTLTSILASLTVGVAVGVLAAMLMFIRSNVRAPVRTVTFGDVRSSRKVRPAPIAELLKQHGRRIAMIDLDGALFFGTADAAAREIERVAVEARQLVLDFRRVGEVDASGARVLLQVAAMLRANGKRLLLATLVPGDARTRAIREMDVGQILDDADFFPDADTAIEYAEELMLAELAPAPSEDVDLPLHGTMLGTGLDVGELASLQCHLTERRLRRGEHVFDQGDRGDAMYVSVRGQIGIWLRDQDATRGGQARRLVSFAPGVVFGEMALLRGATRSADAVAEDEAVVLRLSKESFDRLAQAEPSLHAKLLFNLSVHLSSRLRAITDELQAALSQR